MTCLALDLGLLEIKINSGLVGNSLDSFYFIGIVQKANIRMHHTSKRNLP